MNRTDIVMSLQNRGNMPAAAAYTILKEHPALITRLDCSVCGSVSTGLDVGDCFRNHMRGRVNLILTEDPSGGIYNATVTGG